MLLRIIYTFMFSLSAMGTEPIILGNVDGPPYYNLNVDKSLFLQEVLPKLQAARLKYKVLSVPPSRAYDYISKGEIDLWISFKSPRYDEFMLYSKKEILIVNIQVCSLTPINYKLEDLNGKNLTVINGHLMGNLIYYFEDKKNQINLTKVANRSSLLKMLFHQRSKLIIGYEDIVNYYLKKQADTTYKGSKLYCNTIKSQKVYLMLNKRSKNFEIHLNNFKKVFPKLFR